MNGFPGWKVLSASGIVSEGSCFLYGLSLVSGVLGDSVVVYEGQDDSSGRKVVTLKVAANVSNRIMFNAPLPMARGVYVVLTGTTPEVSVFYSPGSIDDPR